jgi:hypothetical protein
VGVDLELESNVDGVQVVVEMLSNCSTELFSHHMAFDPTWCVTICWVNCFRKSGKWKRRLTWNGGTCRRSRHCHSPRSSSVRLLRLKLQASWSPSRCNIILCLIHCLNYINKNYKINSPSKGFEREAVVLSVGATPHLCLRRGSGAEVVAATWHECRT